MGNLTLDPHEISEEVDIPLGGEYIHFRRRKQLRNGNNDLFVIIRKKIEGNYQFVVVIPSRLKDGQFSPLRKKTSEFEYFHGEIFDTASSLTKAIELGWEYVKARFQ